MSDFILALLVIVLAAIVHWVWRKTQQDEQERKEKEAKR
jgi:hypothetical protein